MKMNNLEERITALEGQTQEPLDTTKLDKIIFLLEHLVQFNVPHVRLFYPDGEQVLATNLPVQYVGQAAPVSHLVASRKT